MLEVLNKIADLIRTNPDGISPKKNRNQKRRKRRGIRSGWYKNFYLDSGWELAWVLYNEDHNILFERNEEKFPYFYQNKKHFYIPDFKMPDGTFVELKGREPKICHYKYTALPKDKLKVLYAKDLKHILKYVETKYGKDYWRLFKNDPW